MQKEMTIWTQIICKTLSKERKAYNSKTRVMNKRMSLMKIKNHILTMYPPKNCIPREYLLLRWTQGHME